MKGGHILLFPFPAQGHTPTLLQLTHHLYHRGLTITLLTTPANLPNFSSFLSSCPEIQTLVLPFPPHPFLPPGVENVKDIGNHANIPFISALTKLQDPIIQWFQSHPNPPVALLSDFFLGWTCRLANALGIPRICFYSCGAFLNNIFNALWSDSDPQHTIRRFEDIPRTPEFRWEHLPSLYRQYTELQPGDPSYGVPMSDNPSSWAAVFNSFHALEDEFLDFFTQKVGHPRVYTVGPLNLTMDPSWGPHDKVISWLDQWTDGSVLYVCFGSQKILKKAHMETLAMGLAQSGAHFVWAVKLPTAQQEADGYGSVPDGFEEQVCGRGLVVREWAPQEAILRHRAVGSFLSHCGWNSSLEALSGGVMILGWPMEADQFVNAKLLVEYKGVAVLVWEGDDPLPDPAELGRKIRDSMHGGHHHQERIRVREIRNEALKAVKLGASYKDLDKLVQDIKNLPTTVK